MWTYYFPTSWFTSCLPIIRNTISAPRAGVSPTHHSKTDWLVLMLPHSLDLTGGLSSSSSIWLVSTWTSRCVRRLTLELKMAARLLHRRADSALSRYSLSSQDRGLHAEDSGKTQQKHIYSTITHLHPPAPRHNLLNTNTGLTRRVDILDNTT